MQKINIIFSLILLVRFAGATQLEHEKLNLNLVKSFCDVYNLAGEKIMAFPNQFCDYAPNGAVVMAGQENISLIDKYDVKIWEKSGHFHHQIKWSEDFESILAISSQKIEFENKLSREDLLLVYEKNGKIRKSISSSEILKKAKLPVDIKPTDWFRSTTLGDLKQEISHFNSFYVIPTHSNKSIYKFFPPGGFIANSIYYGIFSLDSNLKNVLYHFKFPQAIAHRVHDVQVNKSGNILIFVNEFKEVSKYERKSSSLYSAVVEYAPLKKKILWKFESQPADFFYSPFCGGVQEIGSSTILVSDYLKGFYLIDKKSKKSKFSFQVMRTNEEKRILRYQDIKLINLDEFIETRKKLKE